jgi:subtilisin family serine protease
MQHDVAEKISPAFQPFLAEGDSHDRRDAIVVFRTPQPEGLPVRGRIRALKQRLDIIKAQARNQTPLQAKVSEKHQKSAVPKKPHERSDLELHSIGAGALPVSKTAVTRKSLLELARQPEVVAILPNQRIHLIEPKRIDYDDLSRHEAKEGLTWGLQQLEIPEVWKTTRGKDIQVGVLDTGVHGDHPSLVGRVKSFVVIDPLGRRVEARPAFDGGQHGTHVCGTIAGEKTPGGTAIGVAPEAALHVASVLLGAATLSTLIEGISWAVEMGADVISMSLGFTYYEPLFTKVFDTLLSTYGIIPVVAIGNENHGNTSSPGNAYNALSVGAAEKGPGKKLGVAAFSSGASLVFPGQEIQALVNKPDLVAPGVQVYSCIPPTRAAGEVFDHVFMDGTSMATPHVAGCVALLMAAQPEAPVSDIIQVLKETALHPDGDNRRPDNRWGYGMIRPTEALKALSSA